MNDSLSTISQELEEEHGRLTDRSEALATELRKVEDQLKRVRSALKALTGKPSAKQASKTKKQCASKAEVVSIIETLLRSEPALSITDLGTRVERQVVESGKSRMGLALRLKEALATPRFIAEQDSVRLATNRRVPATQTAGGSDDQQADRG